MAFWKKKYFSELFNSDVWIVNVGIEQARGDPEISETTLPIFTSAELTEIKNCPEEHRGDAARAIFLMKTVFPGSRVVRCGKQIPVPTIVY